MIRTSLTHPLRVDFIDADQMVLPGRIGLTLAPGKHQQHGLTGHWQRDLDAYIGVRTHWQTDVLLSLIEEHEFASRGARVRQPRSTSSRRWSK